MGTSLNAWLLSAPIPTGITRTFGTAFQVDVAAPALVIYNIHMDVTAGLLTPANAKVDLLVDTVNPPVANVGTVSLYTNQLLGIASVGVRNQADDQLTAWVAGGQWVKLVSSGTGTFTNTLVSSTESVWL